MNPEQFPLSNVDKIQIKLLKGLTESRLPLRDTFREIDEDDSGYINMEEFKEFLKKYNLPDLEDQEVLAVMRRFGDGDEYIFYEELCDSVARAHWSRTALQTDKLDGMSILLSKAFRIPVIAMSTNLTAVFLLCANTNAFACQ